MARYLIKAELGPQRHTTPEGFLICTGVPIARTGEYEYNVAEGMSPGIEPGPDGTIISRREEAEVFAPAALASFEGKPVTSGHPPVDEVTPDDWRQYAVGHVTNVRRGEGDNADKVVADLVISDAAAIEAINSGLREVSCGYDVTVEQVEPGVERQTRIRGNHVALVDAGRAGPECAIKDSKGGVAMDKEVKEGSLFSWDQVKEMLGMLLGKGNATETVTTETTETTADKCAPKGDDEIDELKARIAELEAERDALRAEVEGEAETDLLDEEAIVETTAEEKTDAKPLGFANRVEILAPGMRYALPKSDAKADARKAKLDAMRRALDRACDDDRKRAIIMSVAGRKVDNWAAVKDNRVALVFKAASAALASINDARIPAPVAHGDAATMDDYAAKVAERYAKFGK